MHYTECGCGEAGLFIERWEVTSVWGGCDVDPFRCVHYLQEAFKPNEEEGSAYSRHLDVSRAPCVVCRAFRGARRVSEGMESQIVRNTENKGKLGDVHL